MAEKLVISISGKGGTGKTTVTALLLKWLIQNTEKISLVVDADPATNLPDVLGVELQRTVGQSSKELKDKIEAGTLSPTLSKKDVIEANVFQTLVEEDRFSLGSPHREKVKAVFLDEGLEDVGLDDVFLGEGRRESARLDLVFQLFRGLAHRSVKLHS